MNKERFQEIQDNPDKIDAHDLVQMQAVIRDYPFFHFAHHILLYGLHRHRSEKFQEQLKQSAVFLTSRPNLVNTIINGWPVFSPQIKKSVVLAPLVEELPNKEVEVRELEIETTSIKENLQQESIQNVISDDLSFDDNFAFSLEETQSVEITEKKEEEITDKQEVSSDLLDFDLNNSQPEEEGLDLIDHFLKVNPRIVPKLDLEDTRGDISIPGLKENDEIVTETLADIYEQQGHFVKAKEAYEKLILKFPEKSAYFGTRIQELEKRIK